MADTAVQRPRRPLPAPLQPMADLLADLRPQLTHLLPVDISTDQFRAALWLELTSKPALKDCVLQSIRECAVKAATYGMLPGRDCYFLPFNDKKRGGKVATYVPGYFGIIRSLERSGKVKKAFAHPVYEGDEFAADYFSDVYRHVPAVSLGHPRGTVRFYYGAIVLKDGTVCLEIMSLEDLEAIRLRAPAHDEGPWVTDRDMMCRKTALKRCAKYVQLTPEAHTMLEEEEVRALTDIPAARTQQHIVEMWGPGTDPTVPTRPEPPGAPAMEARTGEVLSAQEPEMFGWPEEEDVQAGSAVET